MGSNVLAQGRPEAEGRREPASAACRASPGAAGWGSGDEEPLFELRGPDGKTWMLYEDGTAIGFPADTVTVNRARPQLDLLRGRIKEFEAALIADQQ